MAVVAHPIAVNVVNGDLTYDLDIIGPSAGDLVVTGEETFPRTQMTSAAAVTMSSQQMRLTYFTSRRSASTTQVKIWSGTQQAVATPTLCRIGLYTAASDGSLALVASTANDTALFAAATTAYTRSWSTPYSTINGQRYALGVLVVSSQTMPSFGGGAPIAYVAESTTVLPVENAVVTGQSDLPSTVAAGSLTNSGMRLYGVIS